MQLSDAEWKVMHCVWNSPRPASARDVLTQVAGETAWAYTTVKTILARLVEKGALRAEKRLNTSLYTPLVTRANASTSAVRSLVERVYSGAVAPLVSCLIADEKLSAAECAQLRKLLDESAAASPTTTPRKKAKHS